MQINQLLATKLIFEQFPKWSNLAIKPVPIGGHDNRTFRLGDEMLIRMPSAEEYKEKVVKEHKWLPVLAPHLSLSIPSPIALGKPSAHYPWNWSIYRWIEGNSANEIAIEDIDLEQVALGIADFLKQLHEIETRDAPVPGSHNFFRGDSPLVYDAETRAAIAKLGDNEAIAVWEKAISSNWQQDPVWIHGDLASGNIILQDGKLSAVIDFSGICVGDPACDLVIAWTFLKGRSRQIFKENMNLDANTWARARGWALWKALITLVALDDKAGVEATKQRDIINSVIEEDARS